MNTYNAGYADIAIIGGGHAGCEAALAASRLGCTAVMFAINLDSVANLPCNPNIGGTAKGHLVREIDALGGEMGKIADKVFIQSRMLNRGKGPAVHSLRVQADRRAYQGEMKSRLENQPRLDIKQAEIVDIKQTADGWQVTTHVGAVYDSRAVIIAAGTFLQGKIIIGDASYSGGPDGLFAATALSNSLEKLGIQLMRFKTGTPARVHRDSVDFSKMEVQKGDIDIVPFSFENDYIGENKADCYLTYTNETTHQIIRDNLHRSPLYSGNITGIGPRYCPSIEDKIVRFADKDRHQIFIEPMGLDTKEMYVQGMSTSLPEDVQISMLRSILGLENVKMMRSAYAIEYDCADPTQLKHTLEFKNLPGLFGAGQFNGSSGYEEAAAQGLMAGINAAGHVITLATKNRHFSGEFSAMLRCQNPPINKLLTEPDALPNEKFSRKNLPTVNCKSNKGFDGVVLGRDQAYIGVLIDDLVTKGTAEPYRMMTARAEFRLLLRQDNADLRLTPLGHEIGLISQERYQRFTKKRENIEKEVARLNKTVVPPSAANPFLEKHDMPPLISGIKLCELLRRPSLTYESLKEIDSQRPLLDRFTAEQVEISVKYEGYIKRQMEQSEQFKKMENLQIPQDVNFSAIDGIRIEARQKLEKHRPKSISEASRISGVSPADLGVLIVYIKTFKMK